MHQMYTRRHHRPLKIMLLPVIALTGSTAALAGPQLVINGKVASNDVRSIGGTAYVKVADVARALGMVVVKRGSGYEIKKPGGANPIKGALQGKIGDVLFDGRWRFQVLKMEVVESYKIKANSHPDYAVYRDIADYDTPNRVLRPKPGYTLIALPCRVTNGRNQNKALWVLNTDTHTALADTQGESHPPIAYDFEGAPIQSKPLLPGAKLDFTVLFSVPQGRQLKDLVFTLRTISNADKSSDVRVSLQKK